MTLTKEQIEQWHSSLSFGVRDHENMMELRRLALLGLDATTARADGIREGLEMAAKAADKFDYTLQSTSASDERARQISAAIRALKDQVKP